MTIRTLWCARCGAGYINAWASCPHCRHLSDDALLALRQHPAFSIHLAAMVKRGKMVRLVSGANRHIRKL
jgi:hypothetical protein